MRVMLSGPLVVGTHLEASGTRCGPWRTRALLCYQAVCFTDDATALTFAQASCRSPVVAISAPERMGGKGERANHPSCI